jgi:hypothetical protein
MDVAGSVLERIAYIEERFLGCVSRRFRAKAKARDTPLGMTMRLAARLSGWVWDLAALLMRRASEEEADGEQVAKYVCRAQHAVPLPEK